MTKISVDIDLFSDEKLKLIKKSANLVYEAFCLVFPAIPVKIAERRAEILTQVITNTQEKLTKAGLTKEQIKHCSLKLGIPIVESASLEEDPTLQDIWANLLANICNPHFKYEIRQTFINIIKELTPVDAFILNAYYHKRSPFGFCTKNNFVKIVCLEQNFEIERASLEISREILTTLGLLEQSFLTQSITSWGDLDSNIPVEKADEYYITALGKLFVITCIKDASNCNGKTTDTSCNI